MPGRIEDHGPVGDRETVAPVGRDGSIDRLCRPRFASDACFAALLGGPEHGRWPIAPSDARAHARRRYRDGSPVLDTEFETPDGGVAVLTDCTPPRGAASDGAASDLVRPVTGRRGRVALRMEPVQRFGYGANEPWVARLPDGSGTRATAGPDLRVLRTPVPLALDGAHGRRDNASPGAGRDRGCVNRPGNRPSPRPRVDPPVRARPGGDGRCLARPDPHHAPRPDALHPAPARRLPPA